MYFIESAHYFTENYMHLQIFDYTYKYGTFISSSLNTMVLCLHIYIYNMTHIMCPHSHTVYLCSHSILYFVSVLLALYFSFLYFEFYVNLPVEKHSEKEKYKTKKVNNLICICSILVQWFTFWWILYSLESKSAIQFSYFISSFSAL